MTTDRVVHDLGRGAQLTMYGNAQAGIDEALKLGHVYCMPAADVAREVNGACGADVFTRVDCPHCGRPCLRHRRIPPDARVACTTCALKLGRRAAP